MNFLFITKTSWEEPPRARHQLARSLVKKNHQVVFVAMSSLGMPRCSLTQVEENILLVQPSWFLNPKLLYRIPIANELFQMWLFQNLSKKYEDFNVINFDPSASLLYKYFPNYVFYCNDDFTDKKRAKFILSQSYFKITQKIVARKANFCVAVSAYLKEQIAQFNPNTHLILTAAGKVREGSVFPQEKSAIINAVYVGWLSKINIKWVLSLAKNPKIRITLIGPATVSQSKSFAGVDNIELRGELVGEELFCALDKADVCMAPYEFGRDTNEVYTVPNKFWLYLSFGKPVVTARINRLHPFPSKMVYQSNDHIEFENNVIGAVKEDTKELFDKRKGFIKNNDWSTRVDELLSHY
jgi:hypothetical protein